jgi:hypothetical protein
MFLYNWPDDGLYSRSKPVASQYTIKKSAFCVIGYIRIHYECYTNVNVPYTEKKYILFQLIYFVYTTFQLIFCSA